MLRTSLRSIADIPGHFASRSFLSSNAQDFIEDRLSYAVPRRKDEFLSSHAQDFIEDTSHAT